MLLGPNHLAELFPGISPASVAPACNNSWGGAWGWGYTGIISSLSISLSLTGLGTIHTCTCRAIVKSYLNVPDNSSSGTWGWKKREWVVWPLRSCVAQPNPTCEHYRTRSLCGPTQPNMWAFEDSDLVWSDLTQHVSITGLDSQILCGPRAGHTRWNDYIWL